MKLSILILITVLFFLLLPKAESQSKELSREQIIEAAIKAVQEKGISVENVTVMYDEGNKRWEEKFKFVKDYKAPNRGNFKGGSPGNKNYQVVYFDFEQESPNNDIWVFVDKDTGKILTFYTEK